MARVICFEAGNFLSRLLCRTICLCIAVASEPVKEIMIPNSAVKNADPPDM